MSDDIVVVDNGQTYETSESAIVAKNEADRAEQWAKYSENKANLADERAIDAAESSDAAAQAATAAIAAKDYAENAITDNNLITVATDLKATSSNIKTVAGNIANVNAVGENIDNVNAVAGNAANINAVNANKDNIDTVADNIDGVNDVAMIKDDVIIVSGSASDIMTVVDNVADVKNVSNNMQDVKNAIVSAANAKASENNAKISENNAQTWAEGEDYDVVNLGGTHSAKKWAELAGSLVNVQPASETTSGIVRLSTTAEAKEGFDDSTAITPLKMAKVISDNVGRGVQLGFIGTLEGNLLTFETTDPNPYTLRHNYDYEIDLLFEAVGELPDSVEIVIKNGNDYINIVNVLHDDYTSHITVGDLRQIMKYSNNIGWRWIFMSRYTVTASGDKVFVMPSTVVNVTEEGVYNKIHDALISNPDMIRYENDVNLIRILAGSTFVKPNGVNTFERITLPTNISTNVLPNHNQLIFSDGTHLYYIDADKAFSQATAPTAYSMMLWYDTTENKIKYTGNSGTTWQEGYCLPFGTANSSGIIDCFCNGIGYFASCVWILDGVKVLIPNGKQKDGSFNNITYTVTRPTVFTFDDTREGEWALSPSGIIVAAQGFVVSEQNKVINKQTQAVVNGCPMGKFKTTTGRVETLEVREILELTVTDASKGSSGGLEVGDIGIAPLGIDETKNMRRYLNGQVISQTQFTSFTAKIKAAVLLYPALSTTETNWQAEVTNSKLGQCGKFVIDDTLGTIRLPKVVNINGLQDLANLGGIKSESLPNIKGEIYPYSSGGGMLGGAFYASSGNNVASRGSGGGINILLNASRSSSTYQDDAPVQQEAVQYPFFIQVAANIENSIDVTREIQLNNPFSLLDYKWSEYELSNASWLISNGSFHSGATYTAVYELLLKIYNGTETKDGVSVKLSTEDYTDYDFVLNTADTTFRLPVKVASMPFSDDAKITPDGQFTLYNTVKNNDLKVTAGSRGYASGGTFIMASGSATGDGYDVTQYKSGLKLEVGISGLYLYFYVGETIQDANIINAAGVLTRINTLSDEYIYDLCNPSNEYIDISSKVQNDAVSSTHNDQAPANGFIVFGADNSSSLWIQTFSEPGNLTTNNNLILSTYVGISGNKAMWLPIKKGQYYSVRKGGGSTFMCRFYYAEGEI